MFDLFVFKLLKADRTFEIAVILFWEVIYGCLVFKM